MIGIDTNLLVYARDRTEPSKQRQALGWLTELWARRQGLLSFQVLHEFYVTVTRKLEPGMTPDAARSDIRALMAWEPIATSERQLEEAWRIEDRFGVSWWDSLIVAAARLSGARYLLSEDLQDGMDFDQIRVVNPFRASYSDLD